MCESDSFKNRPVKALRPKLLTNLLTHIPAACRRTAGTFIQRTETFQRHSRSRKTSPHFKIFCPHKCPHFLKTTASQNVQNGPTFQKVSTVSTIIKQDTLTLTKSEGLKLVLVLTKIEAHTQTVHSHSAFSVSYLFSSSLQRFCPRTVLVLLCLHLSFSFFLFLSPLSSSSSPPG